MIGLKEQGYMNLEQRLERYKHVYRQGMGQAGKTQGVRRNNTMVSDRQSKLILNEDDPRATELDKDESDIKGLKGERLDS